MPPQNRLPIGGALVFSSDALNNFLVASLNAGKTSVTIVAGIVHDGKVPITDWKNFNYAFNPKEQTTLSTDVGYDADTANPTQPAGQSVVGGQQRGKRQWLLAVFAATDIRAIRRLQ